MYKYVFLFCAIFFLAGIGQAEESEAESNGVLDSAKESLDSILNEAIGKINNKVKVMQNRTNEFADQLAKDAEKIQKSVYDKVKKDHDTAANAISESLGTAGNVNVTECSKMANELSHVTASAFRETGKCINDIVEDAERHVINIIRISNIVLKNLTEAKDQAKACIQKVDGIKTGAQAVVCLNVVGAKGAWATVSKVPGLFINMSKLTLKMYALLPQISLCSTVESVKTVKQNTSKIVKRVKECVAQKLAEVEAEK